LVFALHACSSPFPPITTPVHAPCRSTAHPGTQAPPPTAAASSCTATIPFSASIYKMSTRQRGARISVGATPWPRALASALRCSRGRLSKGKEAQRPQLCQLPRVRARVPPAVVGGAPCCVPRRFSARVRVRVDEGGGQNDKSGASTAVLQC